MSSKKNNKVAQATVDKKNNSKVQDTKVKNEVKKEVPKEEKKDTKTVNTPPPADPSVEEVKVEVVNKETTENIPGKLDMNNIKLKSSQRLSGDGYARLLDVAQRHISKMSPDEPTTIKMEQAFTYNLAWAMTKATIQAREEKLELGIAVPNDDVIVQDVIDTFNNLGVALAPHEVKDGQMTLQFKEIKAETVKAAKEEIKQEKSQVIPELDPTKWASDDDAKKGLSWVLTRNDAPFPNRFNECIMKVKQYRQNQETDVEKKATWDKIGLGALFEDAVSLLGNKSTALVRGLCQGSVASLIGDHNPIFAHATIKYNLPVLSEEEIADLLKSFIKVRNEDPSKPVDETLAVKNGILEPTREFFLSVPKNAELKITEKDVTGCDIGTAKKIMNKFKEAYKGEFQMVDPQYHLKVTNKMIEIRNLYVAKDAAFVPYTEEEYPKAIG